MEHADSLRKLILGA